jgi:alpha-glucoside transport system permease protein
MSSGGSIAAEPPATAAPQVAETSPGSPWRGYGVALAFLAPALVMLAVWVLWPTVYTIWRSFYNQSGDKFVWLDNYQTMFQSNTIQTAIKNNVIWVVVVPMLVTAIGLIFAVLVERVRWSVAFKTIVFMPMAISLFATGVIWRIMYQQDPSKGAVNAIVKVFEDSWNPGGPLSDALSSTDKVIGDPKTGLTLKTPLHKGSVALIGLTAIPPQDIPGGAKQAAPAKPDPSGVTGTVWRDFKPGGGTPGKVEKGEMGLPGVTVELKDSTGKKVASAKTNADGTFDIKNPSGTAPWKASIGAATFAKPFGGISWLGPSLITPSIIIAYIWVWAGFALVVIAAGLAAIPRDTLEAARTDGATEFQVFRRVTVPLLMPVLTVVFFTMLINVLKVFDIVLSIAPGSTQDDAAVIALAMWRTSFGGVNDFGLGSAIAVFLFLLVLPILALNVRRFRREV